MVTISRPGLLILRQFCFIVLILRAAVTSHVDVFTKQEDSKIQDRTYFSSQHSSRSRIDCAASCEREESCQKFSFDRDSKLCSLGNTASGSAVMYRKHGNLQLCPGDKGYKVWIYPDVMYCLKYYATQAYQPAAKTACNSDGAHLALIESDNTRSRLLGILNEVGGSGYLWFDGFDTYDNGVFMSRKGLPLPWTNWYTNQPENRPGEDCIAAGAHENFLLRDSDCRTSTRPTYFCQIDIA